MYGVELYAAVRLAVVEEGLSHHEAGRRLGIDRRTVKKMLSYSSPPRYRRTKPVRRPKLDGFTGIVDAILEADADFGRAAQAALVKTARRKFMVPIPKVHDLSVLNERLTARCLERLDALEQGDRTTALLGDLGCPCAICRAHPTRPASMCRAGSPRLPWCAIASWTTRRRRRMPTRR